MVDMFIGKAAYLLRGHFAKKGVYKTVVREIFLFIDQANPFGLFGLHIARAGNFKARNGWHVFFDFAVVFQHALQGHFTKQLSNKRLFVGGLTQHHFFPQAAMFQHLVNGHFAPLRGTVFIKGANAGDKFLAGAVVKNGFHGCAVGAFRLV